MSDITIADDLGDLGESSLTVSEAVCVDDAEFVTESIDDQPETTLAEWGEQ